MNAEGPFTGVSEEAGEVVVVNVFDDLRILLLLPPNKNKYAYFMDMSKRKKKRKKGKKMRKKRRQEYSRKPGKLTKEKSMVMGIF